MEENLKDKIRFESRKAIQDIFLKLLRYLLAAFMEPMKSAFPFYVMKITVKIQICNQGLLFLIFLP